MLYGFACTACNEYPGNTAIQEHNDIPPLKVHEVMAIIMMILLIMHIAGVIKHYIITRENALRRMS